MIYKKIISIAILVIFTFLLISCSNENIDDSVGCDDGSCLEENESVTTEVAGDEISVEENEEIVINTNPTTKTVTLENHLFNPLDVDISPGDTIEWINSDDQEHSITFENGDFDEQIGIDGSVKYTFSEEGEYRYFSVFEPEMQGTVFVI
ncbi:hypothetical protein HN385_04100 [archaeon]|jgi:plastocyanin|nr:hypothetical protein [archaeon]MBT3451669.1 hypothetical protein [archaeon]MBT6869113.1 hypothetical protein [archaeon]MBT7193356.1 hypothetical protein [archaeon]MBT7380364.1 hypothetical protein [archaeon]